jgi:hypothetical protein
MHQSLHAPVSTERFVWLEILSCLVVLSWLGDCAKARKGVMALRIPECDESLQTMMASGVGNFGIVIIRAQVCEQAHMAAGLNVSPAMIIIDGIFESGCI